MPYTINDICKQINAKQIGSNENIIDWLLTDSRSLSFPETTLFFALSTKRNKGVKYIPGL